MCVCAFVRGCDACASQCYEHIFVIYIYIQRKQAPARIVEKPVLLQQKRRGSLHLPPPCTTPTLPQTPSKPHLRFGSKRQLQLLAAPGFRYIHIYIHTHASHHITSHHNTIQYNTIQYMHACFTFHTCTTLHYATLHHITLHYITCTHT